MHFECLNAAVVGLGIGMQHAFAISENQSCHLARIVDFNDEKLTSFVSENKFKNIKKSLFDEVINDNSIQLVCIASYDDDHYEQVISCLNSNKHVFVEKPLCQTKDQLLNIYNIYIKGKCALASNLVLRTAPLYQHIKQIINDGRLGEIYSFDGDYLYGRLHKITEGWRNDVDNYSVMEGGGIHMIDLMMWLTNQRPTSVTSHVNKVVTKKSSFRYHDFHNATFSFESGLIGRITANFGCVHHHQHVVRIFGTKGTFIYDDMGARIHWSSAENSSPEFIKKEPKPYKKGELIHELVDQVQKNDFVYLAQREFDLMSAVLAADKAVNNDKTIEIEYLKC